MDAKDRRIAELEAENAAQARRIAELEKRPVLEADVLASFSAFDANGDGYLTKEEVVSLLTRNTASGYAMTRAAEKPNLKFSKRANALEQAAQLRCSTQNDPARFNTQI